MMPTLPTPVSQAKYIQMQMFREKRTIKALAKEFGRSEAWVHERLALNHGVQSRVLGMTKTEIQEFMANYPPWTMRFPHQAEAMAAEVRDRANATRKYEALNKHLDAARAEFERTYDAANS